MTPDDQALQSSNPFDQIDPTENEVNYKPATPPAAPVNPFDAAVDVDLASPAGASSKTGAFLRAAERGVVPAVSGLAAAGAGAEAGAAVGGGIGAFFGGAGAAPGALVGGLVGGIGGFFSGSYAGDTAQNYGLSKAPPEWVEALGQDERQKKLDQEQHPYASFLGGLAPYALTMSPAGVARSLPENATNLQRLMANPATARIFGGAAMGGLELGQEAVSDDHVDWNKVAIATGFGVVFNRPNAIGERISSLGARPFRGAPAAEAPTLAEASALNVMGEGVTEPVFMGSLERDPNAAKAALQNEITEQATIGKPTVSLEEQVDGRARREDPELFGRYDQLRDQLQTFRDQLSDYSNPSEETIGAAADKVSSLQSAYDELLKTSNGYTGGVEARRLRAQIRDAQSQHAEILDRQTAFAEGRGEDTPEMTAARKNLLETDIALRDVSRDVGLARRRAQEALGSDTAEPTPPEEVQAPPEPGAPPPLPLDFQTDAIRADVEKQLLAAGRPAEEADAGARLIAARYATRAARFDGKLGTPLDLYTRESAEIRGPKGAPKAPPAVTAKEAVEVPANGQERTFNQDLHSPRIYEQPRRGRIRFVEGKKPLITLAKAADASTFVHESAHQFLEEMLRDSEHEAAPDALKDDVSAVRKYLKADDTGPLKKKEHERFARSFEQYLREGVAPSRQLAGVFAKFKSWMTQVYQTIKGLGRPISDDIRGVFDRMLAEEPERTVIAPEAERAPSMAETHSLDAEHVSPEHAEPAADRVAAERVKFADSLPPEIKHELEAKVGQAETHVAAAGEPGGEAGPGAGRPEAVDAGAGGPDAVTPGGGGGAATGAVGGGGSAPAPEGPRVSEPARSGTGFDKPLSPRPSEDLSSTADRYVDVAGNIRTRNLTNIQQVVDAIKESAGRNNDFRDVRGQMTFSQISDLADELNLKPEQINRAKLAELFGGTQDLAGKVLAGRKLLRDSARDVVAAMSKAADSEDPAAIAEMARVVDRHDMIQSAMSGVTAEWGRAGNAFRSIVDEWDKTQQIGDFLQQNTGRSFNQLKMMAKLGKNLDTPAKVAGFIRDTRNRSAGRMLLEYFINNLISGIVTHVTYVIGNDLLLMEKMGPTTLTAAAIGKARELAGQSRERVYAGEVGTQFAESFRALPKAAQAAIEAARTGQTTLLPGETAYPLPVYAGSPLPTMLKHAKTIGNEDVNWSEAGASAFGLLRGIRDGLISNAAVLKSWSPNEPLFGASYSPLGQIPDLQIKGATVLPLGSVIRAPGRGIAAIHSFFRTANYSVGNAASAYRLAVSEGHVGSELAARIAYLRQNPSEATMELNRGGANDLTLMGPGGELVKKITDITNWAPNLPLLGETPLLKFVDPFVHIASNIIDQAIVKRTPVGILSNTLRADLTGKNGAIAQDTAQARMIVGTTMALGFGGLAAEGHINGSGPTDRNKAAMWRMAGNRAYSVKIGDIWYDTHRLGPLGMLLGISADMYGVAHTASSGDMLAAGSTLMHAFTQNVLDESFMRGPAELIQAIEDHDRYGQRYIQNFLSSFVPFSVGLSQATRASDPYTRQARTVMDSIRAKMPFDAGFGQSTDLFPRRDIWGEPLPNPDALGGKGVTAIWESKVSTDPVNLAMEALGMGPSPVERKIMNVKLTDAQYDDFARTAGRSAKMRLDVLVNSPDFHNMPPAIQRQAITEQISASRKAAQGLVMMKYPSIPAEATAAKLARLR